MRAFVEIFTKAMQHNLDMIQKRTGPGVALCPVIKADAYGHGAARAAGALGQAGMFGVATPLEALELRRAGIETPLLVLGCCPAEYAAEMARQNVSIALFDWNHAQAVSAALSGAGCGSLSVHVKLDTGMSRLGFDTGEEGLCHVRQSVCLPGLCPEAAFTHFATDDAFVLTQNERFRRAVEELKAGGIEFSVLHCANSAAVVKYPESYYDMVRPGLLLYGYSTTRCPRCGSESCLGAAPCGPQLMPAMRFCAEVVQVKTLQKGDTVSYDRTFTAAETMRIAIVSAGYADGVPRTLSNKGSLLLRGREAPMVGRVCMDMLAADVSEIPSVAPGDTAVLFGPDENGCHLDAWTQVRRIGAVPHELLCAPTRRVERMYRD